MSAPDLASAQAGIDAAMDVAKDLAEGRLNAADLTAAVAQEQRALFATVVGPGDALWDVHVDVARQGLAAGGIDEGELAEWLAVTRKRNEPPT